MRRLTIIALLAGTALAGCVPADTRPAVSQKVPADLGLTGAPMPAVDAQWWHALGDPQLDRIVTEAVAGSPTLDIAAARVRQAQAALASN